MIDTHAHINFDVYDDDREDVLQKTFASGVRSIIVPGTTIETSLSALKCAESDRNIYAGVGIHPTDVAEFGPDAVKKLDELLSHPRCVALGEVGLDFYRDASLKREQLQALECFFDLAKKKLKPLIIHNRSAEKEMEAFLKDIDLSHNPGVFHCFDGSIPFAKLLLDYGFFISFTGIVTFKNAHNLRNIVEYVPKDRILLETDSPYLAPHPFRGKRNAPFYLHLVAQKIAEVKNLSFEEVVCITTENAKNLFSI